MKRSLYIAIATLLMWVGIASAVEAACCIQNPRPRYCRCPIPGLPESKATSMQVESRDTLKTGSATTVDVAPTAADSSVSAFDTTLTTGTVKKTTAKTLIKKCPDGCSPQKNGDCNCGDPNNAIQQQRPVIVKPATPGKCPAGCAVQADGNCKCQVE